MSAANDAHHGVNVRYGLLQNGFAQTWRIGGCAQTKRRRGVQKNIAASRIADSQLAALFNAMRAPHVVPLDLAWRTEGGKTACVAAVAWRKAGWCWALRRRGAAYSPGVRYNG